MAEHIEGSAALETIRRIVKDIDIGMLTTKCQDGTVRSRPMSSNEDIDDNGTLSFFADGNSGLVREIEEESNVNVSFSNPEKNVYASVSGRGRIVTDRSIMKQHWKPQLAAWFPGGFENPNLTLVQVDMDDAEYWESSGGFVAHTLAFARTLLGVSPEDSTEHGHVRG